MTSTKIAANLEREMNRLNCKKRVVHILVSTIDPREGGMEQATARIAGLIGGIERTKVYVYTTHMPDSPPLSQKDSAYELINMQAEIKALYPSNPVTQEPLSSIDEGLLALLTMQTFNNSIRQRVLSNLEAQHVIISFYLVKAGFLAQHVAHAMNLQHIACIRGSDFSLHYYTPSKRPAFNYVCRHASWIVATNHVQEHRIGDGYHRKDRMNTIVNSIRCDAAKIWQYRQKDYVQVVADSGYSVKKGTHLLLESIRQLRSEGIDVRLTLIGASDSHNLPGRDYWTAIRQEYSQCDPCGFSFHDFVPPDQLSAVLMEGDIYCSASFSEGSSNALNRAMTMGIPIVATNTGSHGEMIGGASHVRLCPPGDRAALSEALRWMVERLSKGILQVNESEIARWRRMLSPDQEQQKWASVLANLPASYECR